MTRKERFFSLLIPLEKRMLPNEDRYLLCRHRSQGMLFLKGDKVCEYYKQKRKGTLKRQDSLYNGITHWMEMYYEPDRDGQKVLD